MIHHELLRDQGILVTPQRSLEKLDFEMLAKMMDPFIASEGESKA
jgi:hypothetical protein